MTKRTCSIDSCGERHHGRGWCGLHYQRERNFGDPLLEHSPTSIHVEHMAWITETIAYTGNEHRIWPGPMGPRQRYPKIVIDEKLWTVHRYVLTQVQGPPPEPGMHAAHTPVVCHTPICSTPAHIYWATPTQNIHDKWIDGTMANGERIGQARYSDALIAEIRAAPPEITHTALAKQYGMSRSHVSAVRRGLVRKRPTRRD